LTPAASDSQGGWSDPGSTWPQPAYGEEPRDWERRPDYGDSGYTRSDEPLSDDVGHRQAVRERGSEVAREEAADPVPVLREHRLVEAELAL
jgi:hypothetical protein